jgi:hypothetical protein
MKPLVKTLYSVFLISCFGSAGSHAGWIENGVPLTRQWGPAEGVVITSDGSSGAIMAYQVCHDAVGHIIAQHVDSLGVVLWADGGIDLCTALGHRQSPRITSDGAGGAIVSWEDYGCRALYAQRVRESGEIVATLLQDYAVAPVARGIRINWSLTEMDGGVRFLILRALSPKWRFVELEGVAIEKNGLSFVCTDDSCLPGEAYKYRVDYEVEGTARRILFETDAITMPALPVTLCQNHPNPFNPRTTIRFYLPEAQEIFLDVYDVRGERVARLAEGKREKGYHEVIWDGRNASGTTCSSGVYFSRLEAGKSTVSRKMVIVR